VEPWWVKTLFRYVSRRRALGLGPPFAAGERGEAGVDAIAGAPARAAAAAAAPFGGGGAAVVLFSMGGVERVVVEDDGSSDCRGKLT